MMQSESYDDRGNHYFSDGINDWNDELLWAAEGDECEIAIEDLSELIDIKALIRDKERIEKADLSYPIVLTPNNELADGYHRVAKAIIEGRKTIQAKRIRIMPPPWRIARNSRASFLKDIIDRVGQIDDKTYSLEDIQIMKRPQVDRENQLIEWKFHIRIAQFVRFECVCKYEDDALRWCLQAFDVKLKEMKP